MNEQQHLIKIGKTTNKKKSLPFELLVEISEKANILFSNKLQICLEKRLTKEQLQLEKYWYSKAKNLLISSTLINLFAGRIFRRTRLIYLKKRQIMDPQNIVNKINSSLENNTEFINELGAFKHDVDHRLNQLRNQTNDNFNLLASENNKRIIDLQREMMEKIETLKSETNANFDSYESYNGRAYASFAVRIGHNNSELIELKNMLGEYLRGNRKRQYEEQQQSSSFGLKKRKKISFKDIDTGESNSGRSDSSDQSSNNSMESIEEYQNNFGTNHPCIIPLKDFNSKYIAETLNNLMKEDLPNKMEILKNIIICDNAQRQDIKCSFKENYGVELFDQMKTVFNDYHFFIAALMETPDYYDAFQIHRAVEGAGKLDLILIEIMTTRTNSQILSIRSIYSKLFGKDLELDILGEDPGYYLRLLTSLTKGNRSESKITDPVKAHEDVSLLCHAIDSRFGAYEQKFISFLATESYDQLRLTFNEYNQTFQKCPLDIAIIEKFSGDIRIGLLTFVKSISNRKVFLSELIFNSIYSYETNKDFDLVRIIVTRSEIDLADIRVIYKKIYGKKLEQAISEQCLWSYKDCLMSIVKGFKQ